MYPGVDSMRIIPFLYLLNMSMYNMRIVLWFLASQVLTELVRSLLLQVLTEDYITQNA